MPTPLDQQLGDMVWSITTGLHAAYNLPEVFEAISKEAPEPAASAAKQFVDEIRRGADVTTALNRMRQAFPTPYMERLVNAILELQKTAVNLGDALEPLSEEFLDGMASGVEILGVRTKPCKVRRIGRNVFGIVLTQGLNRQIRRMCAVFGYEVRRLQRVRIVNIRLDGIKVGQWRELSASELRGLLPQRTQW